VVNYDLPWNPQRIEQRIGRCHRYGQKHDVVVVNFLNQKNEADLRVYQLLHEKFSLFTGVFGSSDEVLGTIESGVDFEMRIAAIYQTCRKPEQIKEAFDELQLELNFEINEAMRATRQKLLENFDEEVQAKLKLHRDKATQEPPGAGEVPDGRSVPARSCGAKRRFDPEEPRFNPGEARGGRDAPELPPEVAAGGRAGGRVPAVAAPLRGRSW
jgi:superfamily II DNA/RNA helicase